MDHRVSVIVAPAPFVSWEEMQTHGKIEEESDQTYVETLISAATTWLDGATGWLGRSLGVQVLEFAGCGWPQSVLCLPFEPIIEVVSVNYIDPNGDEQSLPLPFPDDVSDLPDVRGNPGDVRIRYRAGYGKQDPDDPLKWINTVPDPIRVAVMMLVSQWYENRQGLTVGQTVGELPFAVRVLVQPYRVYR